MKTAKKEIASGLANGLGPIPNTEPKRKWKGVCGRCHRWILVYKLDEEHNCIDKAACLRAIDKKQERPPKFKFKPKKDCDGNGNTNEDRANRAAEAVATYAVEGGYGHPEDPCVIQDLICDLGHLADRREEDFREIVENGIGCWEDER